MKPGSFILKRYSKPRSVHGVVELVVDHLRYHMGRNLGPLLPRSYLLIHHYIFAPHLHHFQSIADSTIHLRFPSLVLELSSPTSLDSHKCCLGPLECLPSFDRFLLSYS